MSRLLSILVRICLLKPVLCLTGQKNNSSGDMGSFFMFCKLFFMNRQLTSYWLSDVILADLKFFVACFPVQILLSLQRKWEQTKCTGKGARQFFPYNWFNWANWLEGSALHFVLIIIHFFNTLILIYFLSCLVTFVF